MRTRNVLTVIGLTLVVGSAARLSARAPLAGEPPQTVTVATLAGAAPLTPLVAATGIAMDPDGNRYIYEGDYGVIRKLTPEGVLTVVAGVMGKTGSVDGTGAAARLTNGGQLVRTADGTLYFAERGSHTIRKVSPSGVVTTIAGLAGQSGTTDGVGAAARFFSPEGIVVDPAGIVYVADTVAQTIRRIALDGTVTTIAGQPMTSGTTNGTGSAARFYYPMGMAFTDSGDLMVAEALNQMIRRVTPAGVVTRVAAGSFSGPRSIVNVGGGVFWVADRGNCAVRIVTEDGVVTYHPATPEGLRCNATTALSVDALLATGPGTADALVGSQASGLVSLTTSSTVTTRYSAAIQPGLRSGVGADGRLGRVLNLAGRNGEYYAFQGISSATVNAAGAVVGGLLNSSGYYGGVVTDAGLISINLCGIRGPGVTAGVTGFNTNNEPAGNCASVDGTGTAARFNYPRGIAADGSGNFYVADTANHTIRKIAPGDVVTTIAGTAGASGSADGVGAAARFNTPTGIAVDTAGVVYVADSENHTIRRIATDGTVTTLAGVAGTTGGADGNGAGARFHTPTAMVIDGAGLLYVADTWNHTIRQVTASGEVTTLAGQAGVSGSTDGTGTAARFREPQGLAIDATGALYIADSRNYTIRILYRGAVTAPTITAHPANQRTGVGGTVSFQVTATQGTPHAGYHWQVSSDGGTTWTIPANGSSYSGVATRQLSVTAALTMQGYLYRCVVGNVAGSVASSSASLGINTVAIDRPALRFGALKAGATGELQSATPPQSVSVSFVSDVVPIWTATPSASWMTVTNGTGAGAGTFSIGIANPGNVIAGATMLNGTVTISAPNAGITTTVAVQLIIQQSGTSAAPFGNFEIPANGATNLEGAIVVSGWALDDIGIDRVEIWRDLVPGESTPPYGGPGPGNGKVFVAHGLFGSGTRPDVEALFRTRYPAPYRSGWGYMLLTHGFPDRGNGTYTLRAFAYDGEGQYTTLGAKTITVNNNAATKPFGTIDYPAQNGIVSGNYVNDGWVLTPNVSGSPTCTITGVYMTIDSAPPYLPVTYSLLRPDVSGAFPGLSNSAAPGAQITFDTTAYTNGLHQIGWVAYDSCGRGEGLGSRFITVSNSSTGDSAAAGRAANDAVALPTRDLDALGLRATAYPAQTLRMDVLAHAQLNLPSIAGATWTGYELVLGEARRLPIGSTLDGANGRFYWQPMAGFFGTYALRFVARVDGVAVAQVPVRVIVGPGVRLTIDTPEPNTDVAGMFTLEGWVADLGASDGTGIDAVHVWAYPVEGGAPIFAGHATLGVARPDVAMVYGAQFAATGYTLTVSHLPRGLYDVVVYPHSSVDGEFRGARVVRVHVR